MNRTRLLSPKGSSKGFSLIEVTIALGITAVALVSLMGMLPRGMETLRAAADKAIEGRIHQQILGEIQLTPWESSGAGGGAGGAGESGSPIDSFDKQIRYYDDQGIELAETEKGGDSHVYTARIHLPKEGDSLPPSVGSTTHGAVMPAGVNSGTLNYLRLVIVEITAIVDYQFLQSPQTSFDNPDYTKHIHSYRTIVTKMGQEFNPEAGGGGSGGGA